MYLVPGAVDERDQDPPTVDVLAVGAGSRAEACPDDVRPLTHAWNCGPEPKTLRPLMELTLALALVVRSPRLMIWTY